MSGCGYDPCAYEARYRRVYEAGAEFWENPVPTDALTEFICRLNAPRALKILDLGCGERRDSNYLAQKGLDVTAVDLSRSALARAKELCKSAKAHPHFILADITNLPLKGAYYDLAVNVACLHMITNQFKRRKHLSETSRILKSSGLYFSCNGGVKRQTPSNKFYDKLGKRPGTLIPRKIKVQGVEKTIHLPIIAAWLKSRILFKLFVMG